MAGLHPNQRPEFPGVFIHESAYVDLPTRIGEGTRIWHFAHVLRDCDIGRDCTLGQNVMVGPAVRIGDNCKIQNNVALYAMYAGKFENAVLGGKKAADLNKDYPLAYVSQGIGNEALGKYDEAAAAYKQLAAIPGWQARAALGMADMAMLRGRTAEAAAALEPMLTEKLPPDSVYYPRR